MELSDNEKEVLLSAEYIHNHPKSGLAWKKRQGWFTPLMIGGANRSHHSYTLRKLVKKGLMETEQRHGLSRIRGSRIYHITELGLETAADAKKPR